MNNKAGIRVGDGKGRKISAIFAVCIYIFVTEIDGKRRKCKPKV